MVLFVMPFLLFAPEAKRCGGLQTINNWDGFSLIKLINFGGLELRHAELVSASIIDPETSSG